MGRSVPHMDEIRVVTDGACRGNPGPGGWAAIITHGDQTREIGGHEPHTTNNRMELRAAVEALRLVPSNARVRIVTDSQYLVQGATSWVKGWKRNGWQTRDERPVEHRDLWEELDQLAGTRVAWEQVRGHTGHPENERADQLAQSYADRKSPTARITTNIPPQPNPKPATAANTSTSCYLSLVHGRLVRDTTWEACKARVHGVSGARFKKCRTYAEQVATVLAWNLSPTVLDMLEATRED